MHLAVCATCHAQQTFIVTQWAPLPRQRVSSRRVRTLTKPLVYHTIGGSTSYKSRMDLPKSSTPLRFNHNLGPPTRGVPAQSRWGLGFNVNVWWSGEGFLRCIDSRLIHALEGHFHRQASWRNVEDVHWRNVAWLDDKPVSQQTHDMLIVDDDLHQEFSTDVCIHVGSMCYKCTRI